MTCRYPFVLHCKDALQMGVFVIIRFMLLWFSLVSFQCVLMVQVLVFCMYPVQMGYHLVADFISTSIVLILSFVVLIASYFVSILSEVDSTLYLQNFYKELLMELLILRVTGMQWHKVTFKLLGVIFYENPLYFCLLWLFSGISYLLINFWCHFCHNWYWNFFLNLS